MSVAKGRLAFFIFLTFCSLGEGSVFAQPFPQRGGEQFVPRQPPPQQGMPDEDLERNRPPRWPGGLREGDFEQRREERQRRIERARNMARRLLQDPNTPADVKAKARRLDELLTKREGLERELDGKRQDFLRAHSQELDELRQLRERGEILRQNLRSAREKAIAENMTTIQEMRHITEEARETAQEIRQQYRSQRGGRGGGPEDDN